MTRGGGPPKARTTTTTRANTRDGDPDDDEMMTTMTNGADAQYSAKMAKELAEATRIVAIAKSGGQEAVASAWCSNGGA